MDVVVVGAGIVGFVNALQLAKRGLKVTLIDNYAGQKRSYKVGESLLMFSSMMLRTVAGLDEFLNESFPKQGVWFTYGMEGKTSFDEASEVCLNSKATKKMWATYKNPLLARCILEDCQIVRPEAEDKLAEQARRHPNITFMDTSMVKDVHINPDGRHRVDWECKASGAKGTITALWVVDCSGRRRLLAKKYKHCAEESVLADGFETTAVWGQFDGITDDMFARFAHTWPDGEDRETRRDLNTLHLWGDGYWIWVIRLAKNRISVGATFDKRVTPPGDGPKDWFWDIMRRYPLFDGMLREDNMLELRTFKHVQHLTDTFISDKRYGMVGDAASIIDAYYSQGMSLAYVTSWHLANVIQKDVLEGHLDKPYIERVNDAHWGDWLMLRNMVVSKYTTAAKDGRFFFLSHILDLVIFSGALPKQVKFSQWLVGTGGEPEKETPALKAFRDYLEKNLFYTRGWPWKLVTPSRAAALQRHLQEKLGERARWRVEHGVAVGAIRALLRPYVAGPPKVWRMPFSRNKWLDISPSGIETPKHLLLTGENDSLTGLEIAAGINAVLFSLLYGYDALDTSVAKILVRLGLAGRKEAAQQEARKSEQSGSVPVAAASGVRLVVDDDDEPMWQFGT